MRRVAAVTTLLALVLTSGPVGLAELVAPADRSVKRVPGRDVTWPGGGISESWPAPDELRLVIATTGDPLALRLSGGADHLRMEVVVGGERRALNVPALLESAAVSREVARARADGFHRRANRAVLDWVADRAGAVRFHDADRAHLEKVLAEVAALKDGICANRTRNALNATAAWQACIVLALGASGGGGLPACMFAAVVAYYLGVLAVAACNPGGNDRWDCDCLGIYPECMCCHLEPGDYCSCFCGGDEPEECCSWPDAFD